MLPHKPQLERAVKVLFYIFTLLNVAQFNLLFFGLNQRETIEALPEDECSSERPDSHSSMVLKSGKDQHKKLQDEAHGVERRHKNFSEDQQSNKCISTRVVNDVKCTVESDKGEPGLVTPAPFLSVEKKLPKCKCFIHYALNILFSYNEDEDN